MHLRTTYGYFSEVYFGQFGEPWRRDPLTYFTQLTLESPTYMEIKTLCILNVYYRRMILKHFLKKKGRTVAWINPLNPELNPICYLLALLAHHFLHVRRIMVKSLTLRLLMSYLYGARILDVSRSHTTTHHSR